MSLPNTTLWGNVLPGGPLSDSQAGNLDTTQVIDNILPDLHAASRAELTFWDPAELIRYMDEAVKRLSRTAGVFVGRNTDTVTVAGQAAYPLPVSHIATLHVSLGATSIRPANMLELEARNPSFQTDQGTPDSWYEDLLGGASVALAPIPDTSAVTVPLVYGGFPPELDGGAQNTFLSAPSPLKGYLAMCVLAEAYGQEGEMEAQDIAEHCRGRIGMYEQIFQGYYGGGT